MRRILGLVVLLLSNTGVASEPTEWWIVKNGNPPCVSAAFNSLGVDLSPETVIRQHPGCLIMAAAPANPKLLMLDCTRSDVATSFIYAPSMKLCSKAAAEMRMLSKAGVK